MLHQEQHEGVQIEGRPLQIYGISLWQYSDFPEFHIHEDVPDHGGVVDIEVPIEL